MENTPLYSALRAFAQTGPVRMHMPGHKGRGLGEFAPLAPLDVTELSPTGDLYGEKDGPIQQAQALWAKALGVKECLFLTGGSTQGLHAALLLAAPPGSAVLMDRVSHRCLHNAMALLDLHPVWLTRPWLAGPGVAGPLSPALVEEALRARPDIKTVCITSPTYYGVLSDIPALAEAAHRHGAVLVVDAAHGAHLPFLGDSSLSAADLAVVSAHKTLPAPGQTALLLSNGRFDGSELAWAGSVYGTSSPSYPMMAALDLCRAELEATGKAAYQATAAAVARLRRRYPALTPADAPLDPTRLTLLRRDGQAAARRLEELGVWPELADRGHVVLILTCADTPAELARLEGALDALEAEDCPAPCPPPPPIPAQALTPRQALFSPCRQVQLDQAEGCVCARQIAPYPPGVPVAAPGEVLEKKTIAYLEEIGYNGMETISAVAQGV